MVSVNGSQPFNLTCILSNNLWRLAGPVVMLTPYLPEETEKHMMLSSVSEAYFSTFPDIQSPHLMTFCPWAPCMKMLAVDLVLNCVTLYVKRCSTISAVKPAIYSTLCN